MVETFDREAQGSLPVRVRSGEMPGSLVVRPPCVVERRGAKRGGSTGRSAALSEACGAVSVHRRCVAVKEEPSPREQGEGHGMHLGAWSGCGGTSRRMGRGTVRGLFWELGRPSSAPSLRGTGAASAYKRCEVVGGREGVGGGRSSGDGRDNRTRLERRAPASPVHRGGWEGR